MAEDRKQETTGAPTSTGAPSQHPRGDSSIDAVAGGIYPREWPTAEQEREMANPSSKRDINKPSEGGTDIDADRMGESSDRH